MATLKLPPLPNKHVHSYQSSYKRDYQLKAPVPRVLARPTSCTRKHNPQPKHVFLLRRMFNGQPVCNVWTPPECTKSPTSSSVALASKGLVSCAQHSYRSPLGHPNFARRPTRFGSNKKKLNPAIGIVPVTSVWEKDMTSAGINDDGDCGVEPLNMELTGKKRKRTAAYVLDQHLQQYEALADIRARSEVANERYISHAIKRPSRRKLVHPQSSHLRMLGGEGADGSLLRRHRGEFYSLHQPWPACYSCWAGPI